MRPRKTILLLAPCELNASTMSFKMTNWGYRVTAVIEPEDMLAELEQKAYDLVLALPSPSAARWRAFDGCTLAAMELQAVRGSEIRIYDPSRILDPAPEVAVGIARIFADRFRESIPAAVARKRGPFAPRKAA